jgi:hypothetical protein
MTFGPKVRFLPWIGKNYPSGLHGVRTLVLGESHYCNDGNWRTRQRTKNLIKGQVTGKGPYAGKWWFWTKVVRTIGGPDDDKVAFWNSVSYHVYIQQFVGTKPRQRPTDEMWEAAVQPFYEMLEQLKPELLLVLGVGLWEHLPRDRATSKTKTAVRYSIGRSATLAGFIRHPSSFGFPYQPWRNRARKYLLLARQGKA